MKKQIKTFDVFLFVSIKNDYKAARNFQTIKNIFCEKKKKPVAYLLSNCEPH